MHLERLRIKNFRNLADVDVPLRPGTVIVGENRSGKSNLVHALRLVLDPTLPNVERQLRREDFWEGLSDGSDDWDPLAQRAVIEITVEFGEIGSDAEGLTALGQSLIEGDPMRARLTYRFAPRDVDVPDGEIPPYEWRITGGVSDEEVRGDVRRQLRVQFLSALRDVETDITYWRRSPLRPLLEAAAEKLDRDALAGIAEAVEEANTKVLELEPIAELSDQITGRTTALVGEENTSQTSLGVASNDPQRLLRGLRLFTDAARRPLSTASLGSLNVLYFALLQLSLDQEVASHDLAHVVLAVEEPEAHLHPHLQRLIFRDALRAPQTAERTVVVTSHSPHIVSVTPPQSLVVLRAEGEAPAVGVAATAELTPSEWDDIERYLDATRGELVFARRVLLVEGFAEAVLVPKLAHDMGLDLDKARTTVCAIHGTHFASYVRYLAALGTPWAVITDGDPRKGTGRSETSEDDVSDSGEDPAEEVDRSSEELAGTVRAERLVAVLGLEGPPEQHGIFVGDVTLEPDLLATSSRNQETCLAVLADDDWAAPTASQIENWRQGGAIDHEAFMRVLKRFGKARFAQRLAAQETELDSPAHIASALELLLP